MAIIAAHAAQAQSGTLGLVDITTPSVAPGNDINGAATYTIGDFASFSDSTALFTGLQSQTYGTVTFSPGVGTSFSFGSPSFGNFKSTSIVMENSSQGFVSIQILGDYNSGSFDGGAIVNDPASVDLSFTQDPIINGGISDSGEISILPSAVPEPGSLPLLGAGAGVLGMHLRRRKACSACI